MNSKAVGFYKPGIFREGKSIDHFWQKCFGGDGILF